MLDKIDLKLVNLFHYRLFDQWWEMKIFRLFHLKLSKKKLKKFKIKISRFRSYYLTIIELIVKNFPLHNDNIIHFLVLMRSSEKFQTVSSTFHRSNVSRVWRDFLSNANCLPFSFLFFSQFDVKTDIHHWSKSKTNYQTIQFVWIWFRSKAN